MKRGEPLAEESIRWLLELHGEMFLIEQHYSIRTRTRRLALNGTPVAVRLVWMQQTFFVLNGQISRLLEALL